MVAEQPPLPYPHTKPNILGGYLGVVHLPDEDGLPQCKNKYAGRGYLLKGPWERTDMPVTCGFCKKMGRK